MANALDFMIRITQQVGGDNATTKLAQLEKAIGKERQALADLEKQMAKMQSADSINIKDHERLSKAIEASRGKLEKLGDAYKQASNGAAVQQAEMINSALLKIVATVGLVIAAFAALAAKVTSFALETANAHRSMLLMLGALSGSKAAGEANAQAIEKVASSTAASREAIEGFAKKLAIAGLEGKRFEDTLKTMAIASTLLGEEAAGHIESILEKSKALGHFDIQPKALKGLGISFADLARQVGMTEAQFKASMKAGKISVEQGMDAMNKAIQKRFGGDNEALMLDFNVQMLKLKENIAALFKDINIEPFLKALKDVLSVFDQSTASGKAMHLIVKGAFDAIFGAAAKVGPYVKEFLKGGVIMALTLYITFMKLRAALMAAFGGDAADKAERMQQMLNLGKAAAFGLIVALAALGLIIAAVGSFIWDMLQPVIALIQLWDAAEKALGDAGAAMQQTLESFTFPDLGGEAGAMIDGLINGITSKIGDVVAAMSNLGNMAASALRNALGIHSPSRVMMEAGGYTAEGFAQGVEGSAGAAQQAMQRLGAPPAKSEAGKGGDAKGNPGTVTIIINATVEHAKEIADTIEDYFEGKGLQVAVATGAQP